MYIIISNATLYLSGIVKILNLINDVRLILQANENLLLTIIILL